MIDTHDPRLLAPRWDPRHNPAIARRARLLAFANIALAIWYFGWLLRPERVGHPILFVLLLFAELFNLLQAIGFWWTVTGDRPRPRVQSLVPPAAVDVLIPVYNEPLEVVEPTIAAAVALPGAQVRVTVLDDGGNAALERLTHRYGAGYLRRAVHTGAKAGNINHALAHTNAPFVAVLDCDHVPGPRFLTDTLGHFRDKGVAFVQTPQYYANSLTGGVAASAWAQQALFFGPIARGRDGRGAMFCCGTNVVFRRAALEAAGGFPEESLTEDFELSITLHEAGWRSVYVPEVLARGLGPEDMASYISQQRRWARGCLSAVPRVLRAALPLRLRIQYLLSSMYFLTGWTVLIYMTLPIVRILTGAQPLAGATADEFLVHFAPYFLVALMTVATAGAGTYSFGAFSLAAATFWVHIGATVSTLTGKRGKFIVTPKQGTGRPQPGAVTPTLLVMAVLIAVATFGLVQSRSPATLNNVSFALLHVVVLTSGVGPALRRAKTPLSQPDAERAASREAA